MSAPIKVAAFVVMITGLVSVAKSITPKLS